MTLYRQYRPENLGTMIGNPSTVTAIKAMFLGDKDLPGALLLTGPSGCGKTTLARIIAGKYGAFGSDFTEMDAADFRGIDTIRDLRRNMRFRPMEKDSTNRAWLLDECHQLTKDAQNALLKALEDTPDHAVLILATTDPDKLLKTIRNRCMTFTVAPLGEKDVIKLVRGVAESEDKKISKEVAAQIARDSLGSPRAALVILEKIIDLDKGQQAEAIESAAVSESETRELCQALLKKSNSAWAILKGIDTEPETVRRQVLGYMNAVALNNSKTRARAMVILMAFSDNFYDSGKAGLTLACYEAMEG